MPPQYRSELLLRERYPNLWRREDLTDLELVAHRAPSTYPSGGMVDSTFAELDDFSKLFNR
jgi:hypothetical protein